jgi:hypothetical protein
MKHDSGSLSFYRRPCKASMSLLLVSSSRVGKVGCLRGVVGVRRRILVLQCIIRTFPVLFIQLIFVWGAAGATIRTTNQFHFNAAKSCSKSMEPASPRHVVVSPRKYCRVGSGGGYMWQRARQIQTRAKKRSCKCCISRLSRPDTQNEPRHCAWSSAQQPSAIRNPLSWHNPRCCTRFKPA